MEEISDVSYGISFLIYSDWICSDNKTRRQMRRLIVDFLCLRWHSSWRVSSVLLTSLSTHNYVVRAKEIIIFRNKTIRRLIWRLVLLSEQIQSEYIRFIKICYEKWFFSCNDNNWIVYQILLYETSDSWFSLFKMTFIMKSFICFTDIFIYTQLCC
jgi:hypothetical protein